MAGGARRSRAALGKREQGLKKKASELATLCGVDVCLLGVDPDGNFFFWPDDVSELRRIGRRYLDAVGGDDDGKAPRGKKRKRAAAGDQTVFPVSAVPPKKQEGISALDTTLDTQQEQEQGEAEGEYINNVGTAMLVPPFAFTTSTTEPQQAADIGWIGVPPVVPPLFSTGLENWSPHAAVELDHDGHLGELLPHLMSSPCQELPYDLEPLSAVDDGRAVSILADAFLPADTLEAAYALPAAVMPVGPPEMADGGGYGPALFDYWPCADPPVPLLGTTSQLLGDPASGMGPVGLAAGLGFYDDVPAISQLTCSASPYDYSAYSHFIMY